ncbi:SRPBCC domain-containing protein [Streptomyces sp. NPDC026672]|uniref:SRPBCC domain-containing protein n=1 Tax=unclassified Streptomyces TaxID=2593676 RepID=UPI0033CD973C
MEHEVFVPVPAERLREALADPARVARAVPGLQQDAGADPLTGRLKVRFGNHSVTYRGTLRLDERADGTYVMEAEATEARGSGTAALTVTLTLTAAPGGTNARFTTATRATGRATDLRPDTIATTTVRLLTRFTENLAEQQGQAGQQGQAEQPGQPEQPGQAERPGQPEQAEESGRPGQAEESEPLPPAEAAASAADETPETVESEPAPQETPAPQEPPAPTPAPTPADGGAEAGHARRTMIGRSAEEVDHAPPRGRYAPVPAPQTVAATNTLRWAAPAAALVVASAIVVGRALRKRR